MLIKVFPMWPQRATDDQTRVRIKVAGRMHTFTESQLREFMADATHALRVMHGNAQPEEMRVLEQAREA